MNKCARWATTALIFLLLAACKGDNMFVAAVQQQQKPLAKTEDPPPTEAVVYIPYPGDAWGDEPITGLLLGGMQGADQGGDEKKSAAAQAQKAETKQAATQYGLRIHPIDGDGNCLFRGVADQLQKPPFNVTFSATKDYHSTMRHIAVAHVQAHQAAYQSFFPNDTFTSLEDWLTKMRQDKCWGGQVALHALSDALQVTLVAIRAAAKPSEKPTIYKPAQPRGVIYLHFKNGSHYESLAPLASMDAAQSKKWKALQAYITGHPTSDYHPAEPEELHALVTRTEAMGKASQDPAGKDSPDDSDIDSKHSAAGKTAEQEKKQLWWQPHQERCKTTAELVAALNQATDEQARQGLGRWLQQYVDTFASQSAEKIVVKKDSEAYLAAYAALSEIVPKDEATGQLLLRYFNSILHKIPGQHLAGEPCLMQLLVITLPTIDPAIFKGNTADLTALSHQLFDRLKDLKGQDLHAGNYPVYSTTFKALYRAFDLLSDILGAQRWGAEDKVYKRLKEGVNELKKRIKQGGYYPFLHQLYRIEDSLKQLKEPDAAKYHGAAWKRGGKRVGQALGGLVRMLTSIRASLVPGVNQEQFVRGAKSVGAAFHRQGLFKNKETLSKQHEKLSEAMAAIYEGKPGALAEFTEKFRGFMDGLPEPIGAEKKIRIVLSYDLVEKLLSLAHQSQEERVFKQCEELAEALAKQLSPAHAQHSKTAYTQYAKDIEQALISGFADLQKARQAAPQEDSFYHEVLGVLQGAKPQGLLTRAHFDEVAKSMLASPQLEQRLGKLEQTIKAILAQQVSPKAMQEGLDTLAEVIEERVREPLADLTEAGKEDLLSNIKEVKKSLGVMHSLWLASMRGYLGAAKSPAGGARPITTAAVQGQCEQVQQALALDFKGQPTKYSDALMGVVKQLQKAVLARLASLEQQRGLTSEDLQKVLSALDFSTDIKAIQKDTKDIKGMMRHVLEKVTTLAGQALGPETIKALAQEITKQSMAHLEARHKSKELATQEDLNKALEALKQWLRAEARGALPAPHASQSVVARMVVDQAELQLDAARRILVSKLFPPSMAQALSEWHDTRLEGVASANQSGTTWREQGQDYEARAGKQKDPKKRAKYYKYAEKYYQRAARDFERAKEEFPAVPDANNPLLQAVEKNIADIREALKRVGAALAKK